MLEAAIGSLTQKEVEDKLTDAESKAITKVNKEKVKAMKSVMESDTTAEDKVETLAAQLTALIAECKKLDTDKTIAERKAEKAISSCDVALNEVTKTNGVKAKLEVLCRELQKQNKAVMDDSRRVAEEEQSKRAALSEKFQDTIKDVSAKLDAQGDDRIKQFQENDTLREKLKNFADQYELREQHFAHQLKTKDLEQQLNEAKLKHQQEISTQEQQKLAAYMAELETRTKTEIELRSQLSTYSEKFETFQDTLGKSNEVNHPVTLTLIRKNPTHKNFTELVDLMTGVWDFQVRDG